MTNPGFHASSGRSAAAKLLGPAVRLITLLLLAAPAAAATPQLVACNEATASVWGVVSLGSTFGLLKNLQAIPGVTEARFNLVQAVATLKIKPDVIVTDAQIRSAVRSASYTPMDIHRITACEAEQGVAR